MNQKLAIVTIVYTLTIKFTQNCDRTTWEDEDKGTTKIVLYVPLVGRREQGRGEEAGGVGEVTARGQLMFH